jgi:hypothetical protein
LACAWTVTAADFAAAPTFVPRDRAAASRHPDNPCDGFVVRYKLVVDPFSPRLLQIDSGTPVALKPVPFQGRVDELTLERWIVQNPDLVGEPLLVLGHQLAEFEEDKDRLDILALDRSGEIVLVELKVSEEFRVTDLQALAYAGAYAKRSSKDLAGTLQRHLQKRVNADAQAAAPATQAVPPAEDATTTSSAQAEAAASAPLLSTGGLTTKGMLGTETSDAATDLAPCAASEPPPTPAPIVSFEEATAQIAAFIKVDDFDEWQPSQHIRIKLVAPSFPRRVLQTVKWLGDVYSVKLEAITVRLFETAPQKYSLAFERLLPLPAEKDFDMTIREREDRKHAENTSRRPSVLPLLVNAGKLEHGQTLWATQTILPSAERGRYDADSLIFQVRVHAPAGVQPKLAWRAGDDDAEEILAPSVVGRRIYSAVIPGWEKDFNTPVAQYFTVEPGGKTLEEIALEEGLWEPSGAST